MGALVGGRIPERTFNLRCAGEWRLEILIDLPLPRARGTRQAAKAAA